MFQGFQLKRLKNNRTFLGRYRQQRSLPSRPIKRLKKTVLTALIDLKNEGLDGLDGVDDAFFRTLILFGLASWSSHSDRAEVCNWHPLESALNSALLQIIIAPLLPLTTNPILFFRPAL
jgi:hypothetical protein